MRVDSISIKFENMLYDMMTIMMHPRLRGVESISIKFENMLYDDYDVMSKAHHVRVH